MDERITEIRKHLKKKLNPMRYEHTLGVSLRPISWYKLGGHLLREGFQVPGTFSPAFLLRIAHARAEYLY